MLKWLFGRGRNTARGSLKSSTVPETVVRNPNAIARMTPDTVSCSPPVVATTFDQVACDEPHAADPAPDQSSSTPPIGQSVIIVHNRSEKEAKIIRSQAGGRRLFVQQNDGPVRVFAKVADIYCLEGARLKYAPVLDL